MTAFLNYRNKASPVLVLSLSFLRRDSSVSDTPRLDPAGTFKDFQVPRINR